MSLEGEGGREGRGGEGRGGEGRGGEGRGGREGGREGGKEGRREGRREGREVGRGGRERMDDCYSYYNGPQYLNSNHVTYYVITFKSAFDWVYAEQWYVTRYLSILLLTILTLLACTHSADNLFHV